MWSKSWPHLVYGHTGGGRVYTVDIHQLGMGVNDQQEHLSHERSRIIYVRALATKGGPAIPKGVMANREGSLGDSDK